MFVQQNAFKSNSVIFTGQGLINGTMTCKDVT